MSSANNRDKFKNKAEYFLTALSFAVGLGNVWRFPYLCYRNGGGSFFIPYLLSLFFLGLTFFFFESTLGQFTSLGPIRVWRLSPMFKGIGYAMFVMGLFVGVYYNMIVAWSIYYVYSSFTVLPSVPWSNCNNTWNTERCLGPDITLNESMVSNNSMSPSQEYFYYNVLDMTDDIREMGPLRPHLVICLAVSWVIVFFGLSFGTKSLGKISYFTALFPYVMITALLINGLQLDGAIDGVMHYIKPDFNRLMSIDVWADAATQIFFSLSICMGGVITLSSYNPFYNNTLRDSLFIAACNSLTSIYAGFAIFSVIGFMAKQIDKPIDQAADQGVGLAFVAYPAALARLQMAPVWSVVFFLMLITLGFGTQMTVVETIVGTLVDFWPSKLQRRKRLVLISVCLFMFVCALPMCTGAGIYILQLMDSYSVPYSAFAIGFFELIAIAWAYGIDRHMENVKKMLGYTIWPLAYWKFMLKFGCPSIILIILFLVLSKFSPLKYNDYVYPEYAEYIGWGISLSSVSMIPIMAIFELTKVWRGKKTLKALLRPSIDFHNDQVKEKNPVFADAKLSTHIEKGQINLAYITTEENSLKNTDIFI
ncbi:hypothetical protein RDWZM_005321 [Blomia tropicalis]|uniref:Transporter n=1 Tax=Blomia tropicalis TaxID=40697 RepID=A0A9Q0M622_BLOTA|nr:hypothetical protein RDWZM_005321 [Blomia tropicalis]